MNTTRLFLATPLLIGFAMLLAGCSSSPPPNAGTGATTGMTGEKAPAETVKATSEEDPKAKSAVESLEKSGAKLVRREGGIALQHPDGSHPVRRGLRESPAQRDHVVPTHAQLAGH